MENLGFDALDDKSRGIATTSKMDKNVNDVVVGINNTGTASQNYVYYPCRRNTEDVREVIRLNAPPTRSASYIYTVSLNEQRYTPLVVDTAWSRTEAAA